MEFTERLKKTEDFSKVYKHGRSRANEYLVLYVLPNSLSVNRLGISVSRKVGNSVVRHRVKRLIRESYRLEESAYSKGFDLVVIARAKAKGAAFCEIQAALRYLSGKQQVRSSV